MRRPSPPVPAPDDDPRERLARLGAEHLADGELLALVVGRPAGRRAGEVARRVLEAAGGLAGLARWRAGQLARVEGMGGGSAAAVAAAVELGRRTLASPGLPRPRLASPDALAGYLLPRFGARGVEHFGVVLLDSQHRLIRAVVVSTGTIDATIVHPREVFREAVLASAAAVALFHNHPSGDPAPSPDDVALTARLVRAGGVMGITVVDHVVLADARYCSLLERGLLEEGRASDKMIGP